MKKFILDTKNKLFKRFQKDNDFEYLKQVISTTKKHIENNEFEQALFLYNEIKELYDIIPKEKKKEVYVDCSIIHKAIDNYMKELQRRFLSSAEVSKKKTEKTEFIKTLVPGFDELIENGIPRGAQVLVSGGPGTGKTTFCSQLLVRNAMAGEKCLFMSFEETPGKLRKHLNNFGFDSKKYEESGNLIIKNMDPFTISRSVEALLAEARGELLIKIDKTKGIIPEGFYPDIIVIDSLSAIAAAFAGVEEGYRIYIEQLFRALENLGVTSFLITEAEESTKRFSKTGVEEFLADGVIVFYNLKKKNIRISATEIVKLRGTKHKKKIVPFDFIPGKGLEIYSYQDVFID